MNYNKIYNSIHNYLRMPRKVKKKFLGLKIGHCKLKRMLKQIKLGEPIRTMYERREIKPYGMFCPKCGYPHYYGKGNMAEYPEHWENFYCIKCHNQVGLIDNSPFYHVLEYSYNNFKIY